MSVSGSRLMTMPAAWVDAWRAIPSSCRAAPISLSTRSSPAICSRSCGRRLDRPLQADVQLVGHRLRHPVRLGVGQAHGPPGVPDGGLRPQRPEGDDLGHPVGAVLAGDVVDDLAPPAVLEVDVDVRHRHPVGVQEPLEREPIGQRVHRRDAQRVGHDAPRRRSPAGGHDPLLPREAGEVGHDQEVAGVPHPVDDPQLVLQPSTGCLLGDHRRSARPGRARTRAAARWRPSRPRAPGSPAGGGGRTRA